MATHILGDDLSLLSRQRDAAEDGLSRLGREMPGTEFRTLLDTFNDRWVAAAAVFLSSDLLVLLLRLSGAWTEEYYTAVDPEAPGESVGLFGARPGDASPFWHAMAREYFERWIHQSQIRRALGLPSLAERRFLVSGIEVVGAIARIEPAIPTGGDGAWAAGPMVLGPAQQAAEHTHAGAHGGRGGGARQRSRRHGRSAGRRRRAVAARTRMKRLGPSSPTASVSQVPTSRPVVDASSASRWR